MMKMISREYLSAIRVKAVRRRVWFSALSRLERALMSLTIRCVKSVRSPVLALQIGRVVCKILKALKSGFSRRVEEVGYGVAERICQIAVEWGYKQASDWKYDMGFVRFLGTNAINSTPDLSF